jgi:hypothetical protein
MAVQTAAMRDILANSYHTSAAYGGLGQTDTTVTTFPNEISGGTPAYARKALSWSTGNGGTASATFDVAGGITVTKAGVFSAVTAGTYYDGAAVTSQNFASQGTYAATFTFTVT